MPTRVQRPLKIIAFNANGIGRQAYKARKQLQDLITYVHLFSETYMKPHIRLYVPNYDIYLTEHQDGHKGGTAVAVKNGIPHTCADLPPLLSEATGVFTPSGNTEMLFAAVYKSLQKLWINTDITELLSFRNMSNLAGDLSAKRPVWNSKVSNHSGLKLLELYVSSNFEISTPQCSMHYPPDGMGGVLNIVVHQNV
jgi:hypothetical protein